MPYVVMLHCTFDNKADADHIYDQAMIVAEKSRVARVGESGERTSYCGVYEEGVDGVLTPVSQFHKDRFDIVRQGKLTPDDQIADWVEPSGVKDSYPLMGLRGSNTVVRHNSKIWENTRPTNTSEPGTDNSGWEEVL